MKVGIDDLIASGATREEVHSYPSVKVTPVMAPEAYYGLAGRIVETIAPYSEADPVAILVHVLIPVGNLIGRGPHAMVESTEHTCAEFAVLSGESSKGRKGQSWSTPRRMLAQVDEAWAKHRIAHGLSSGEGVIFNVRDERWGTNKKGEQVLEDAGESDKRLLIIEHEFATVLRRMQAESNSLSPVLREAWETGDLRTLTKNSPLRATGAHVSIIAHTTREELVASLTETDRANGFANRFMYFMVRRSKCLPEPAEIPAEKLAPLVTELREVVAHQQYNHVVIRRDDEARELWAAVYPKLSEGEPGMVGAILARSEAHVLRLSVLYAVLDRSPVVRPAHLKAALAVWEYAEASARRIFGDAIGLSVADTILAALRKRGPMTRDQIRELFHRNRKSAEIETALQLLLERGKVKRYTRPAEGDGRRPAEVWQAAA